MTTCHGHNQLELDERHFAIGSFGNGDQYLCKMQLFTFHLLKPLEVPQRRCWQTRLQHLLRRAHKNVHHNQTSQKAHPKEQCVRTR